MRGYCTSCQFCIDDAARRHPHRRRRDSGFAQEEALAKLEAERQGIDNKIVDVQRDLLKLLLGRRKGVR